VLSTIDFLGSYTVNWVLSRVRSTVDLAVEEVDVDAVERVLGDMGWTRISAPPQSGSGRPIVRFSKDIRGTVSLQTRRETRVRIQQRLVDAFIVSSVQNIWISTIRYPDGRDGTCTIRAREIGRPSDLSAARERELLSDRLRRGEVAHPLVRAVGGWAVRQFDRLVETGGRLVVGTRRGPYRRSIWTRPAMSFLALSLLVAAILLALMVDDPWKAGDWPYVAVFGSTAFLIIGAVLFRAVVLGLCTRVSVGDPVRFRFESTRSRWTVEDWITDSDLGVGGMISEPRVSMLVRLNAWSNNVMALVGAGVVALMLFSFVQLLRTSPSLAIIPITAGVAALWLLGASVFRSRPRRATRLRFRGVLQFALALGLAAAVFKAPTFVFYNSMGQTEAAFSASNVEYFYHAIPLLVSGSIGGVAFLVTWLISPKLDRVTRDLLSMGCAALILACLVAGMYPASQGMGESGGVPSVSPVVKRACVVDEAGAQAIWLIGRGEHALHYSRNVNTDTVGGHRIGETGVANTVLVPPGQSCPVVE
jgi:hypothetical protein